MYDHIKHSFWYIELVDISTLQKDVFVPKAMIRRKVCICKKIKVRNEISSLYHNALNKKRKEKRMMYVSVDVRVICFEFLCTAYLCITTHGIKVSKNNQGF
jgi:hypothetical protein